MVSAQIGIFPRRKDAQDAVNQMLRVQRGEECLVIYGLVASFKAEKRKVNVGDVWFRVLPLSLSLSLSPRVRVVVSEVVHLLLIWPHCREICLLYRFSLLIESNWVFFVFLPRRSRFVRKITFNYFYFLTNFIDISL